MLIPTTIFIPEQQKKRGWAKNIYNFSKIKHSFLAVHLRDYISAFATRTLRDLLVLNEEAEACCLLRGRRAFSRLTERKLLNARARRTESAINAN